MDVTQSPAGLATSWNAGLASRTPTHDYTRWFPVPPDRQLVASGATWGPIVGYSRAVRVVAWVSVAGTTAARPDTGPIGGDDIAEQTCEAIIASESLIEIEADAIIGEPRGSGDRVRRPGDRHGHDPKDTTGPTGIDDP